MGEAKRRGTFEERLAAAAPVRVYAHLDGSSTRVIYRGEKPLNIGMNRAKRVARSADQRDQATVLKTLGAGLPRQRSHQQQLVKVRHRYYHDQHDEFVRGQ